MKRATRAWDSEIRQRWLRSWTDRHGHVEEAEPAPAVRRIGNRFPPPPLFLHEPGRFQGTQVEPSRLDGCRQTLAFERVRPQTTHRQSVTETRANGFDSRCFQGSVRLSAGRRAGPHARGSTGTSWAAVRPLLCLCPPATRTRRWPTLDRRSVTTAGVAMVPRSADQRVVVSVVHDLKPSTHGLQRPRTSDCERGIR